MVIVKKPDGYWVTDIPNCEPCGPYATRADAEDTMRRLDRFYKYKDEPGFITCEDRKWRGRNTSTSSDTKSRDTPATEGCLQHSQSRRKRSNGRTSAPSTTVVSH